MNEAHLMAAVRYVELNPVRARLCVLPEDWVWSSARAHLDGNDDGIVKVRPMLDLVSDWRRYLDDGSKEEELTALRKFSKTGRPAGGQEFVGELESLTGRTLRKKKPGPKSAVK